MIGYDSEQRGRYQLLGVAFLLVAAVFLVVTVGMYRKAFTPAVTVTVLAGETGSQLVPGADVKVRGVPVGTVKEISRDPGTARLTLALDPEHAELVPANVSARFVPKTLFGERYVDLRIPAQPGRPIAEGAVIPADRSAAAIELERVSDRLLPLLQAVRPDQVAVTLSAIRQGLSGRGEKLGTTLVGLDTYLKGFNPAVPDLIRTLDALGPVADTYAAAAPDFFGGLADLSTTTGTIADRSDDVRGLLAAVTGSSDNLGDYLRDNRDNLVKVLEQSRPTLDILERYAPEIPCIFHHAVYEIPASDIAFGKGTAHPNQHQVQIGVAANRGKYLPGLDDPKNSDDRGPRCYPLTASTDPAPQYQPGGPLKDGSRHPAPPLDIPNPLDLTGLLGGRR